MNTASRSPEPDDPDGWALLELPADIQAKFDALPASIQKLFSLEVKPDQDAREFVKARLRALRHNGWVTTECIDLARVYPYGFGTLSTESWPVFAVLWEELNEEDAERERQKAEAEKAEKAQLKPRPFVWRDPATIPPRQWLIGTVLIRGYATLLGGSGGVGKTATAIAFALAYITGRKDILNMHVFQTGKVWINVLEDDLEELERRIHAAMIAHHVTRKDIDGKLFVNTGDQRPILLARVNETGVFEVCADAHTLQDGIKAMYIGLTIIDPLVKAHKAVENSNEHMDALQGTTNDVARDTHSSLMLPCHFRKGGGEGGNRDAFRGGGALIDAARVARAVTPMNAQEAELYRVPLAEADQYIKLTDAKANLARKERALWFKLTGVPLGNVTDTYKAGDSVQTIKPWKPPSAFEGLDAGALRRIFDQLRDGPGEGWHYSPIKSGKCWAGTVITAETGQPDDSAANLLRTWTDNGVLAKGTYQTPDRNERIRVVLNEAKVAEILASLATGFHDEN